MLSDRHVTPHLFHVSSHIPTKMLFLEKLVILLAADCVINFFVATIYDQHEKNVPNGIWTSTKISLRLSDQIFSRLPPPQLKNLWLLG